MSRRSVFTRNQSRTNEGDLSPADKQDRDSPNKHGNSQNKEGATVTFDDDSELREMTENRPADHTGRQRRAPRHRLRIQQQNHRNQLYNARPNPSPRLQPQLAEN